MIEKEFAYRMIDHLFEIRENVQTKFIPKEVNQHFQKAKKEGLLGIQAMISHLILEIDKCQESQTNEEPQVKKINVED